MNRPTDANTPYPSEVPPGEAERFIRAIAGICLASAIPFRSSAISPRSERDRLSRRRQSGVAYRALRRPRVAELRPAYLPPDPASRTSYVAGEIGQCDLWFPPVRLPMGSGQVRKPAQLPVLTMIAGYFAVAVGGADPVAAG
jgi:hypothetical protein